MSVIPMNTKGAVDTTQLSSINRVNTNGTVDSRNIGNLNSNCSTYYDRGEPYLSAPPNISNVSPQPMQNNGFGQPVQNNGFGQPIQNNGFGQPVQNNGFGQPVQNNGFGQPVQNNGFGQPVQNNGFGQPMQNNGFGQQPQNNAMGIQPQVQTIETKPVPNLVNQVQKGQKVQLSNGSVSNLKVRLGWNVNNGNCDLDVSAFMLSNTGKVIGDDWFVFYGQETSPDGSMKFKVIQDPNDRQEISLDVNKLNSSVNKIVFVLTINEAFEKNLNFSMVKDAYIRIMDGATSTEFVSYKMADYYSNVISMMIGELYLHNGVWKFNAVGNGVAKDLSGLCEIYGVQVC